MIYPVLYKVKFSDPLDDYKSRTENGIFYAESFTAACDELLQFYGKDDIITMTITLLEEGPIVLSDYWYEKLLHGDRNEIL